MAGLQIDKADGPIRLELTQQRWLWLSGSKENLARYVASFKFDRDEEGAHHHPEHVDAKSYIAYGTMCLIIEVDSDWIEEVSAEE